MISCIIYIMYWLTSRNIWETDNGKAYIIDNVPIGIEVNGIDHLIKVT